MIRPDPRDDTSKKRRFAALMTAGVVALAGVLVAFVSVPEFRSSRDSFRKINPARLTQIRPQPKSKSTQSTEKLQEKQQKQKKKTPERIEAPDLKTGALQANPSPSQTATASGTESNTSSESDGGGLDVKRTQVGELQGNNTSVSSGAGALPSTTTDPSAEPGGGGISVAKTGGGTPGGGGEPDFAGGETVAAGSEEAGTKGDSTATVTVQRAQKEDYAKNVEASKLIQWMKEHPAPLPPGIEQLVGYQPSYLSSKIKELNTSKGQYEMYLMCKQSLREIHIVLVRNGEAKYLVDRSFQKQSRKFRVGPVRRSGGKIIGVQTQAQPRGKKSEEFYSVFLSWWKDTKTDV